MYNASSFNPSNAKAAVSHSVQQLVDKAQQWRHFMPTSANQWPHLSQKLLHSSLSAATTVGLTGQRFAWTSLVALQAGIGYARKTGSNAQLLRQSFERLGVTYIKLGQFIASTPSFFPEAYITEFQKCLDQAPPVDFALIKATIEQQLGKPVAQIFSHIDPVPIATASIAQVHAATLVTGEDVVIKVQKPHIDTVLRTDLTVVFTAALIAEKLLPQLSMLSLKSISQEIRKRMLFETDFVLEAQNMYDFHTMLLNNGISEVCVPQVYAHASSQKVLTMQRLYGVPFSDMDGMLAIRKDIDTVLLTAMNTWFSSISQCASFHADLHAGNLMLLKDGRIGFIDFGIVGTLQPQVWQAGMALMQAMQVMDFMAMAESMQTIGMTHNSLNTAQLAADLQVLFDALTSQPIPQFGNNPMDMQSMQDDLQAVLMGVIKVGKQHGIHFPADFALLFKQLMYFDKFMHHLAPDVAGFRDDRLLMR